MRLAVPGSMLPPPLRPPRKLTLFTVLWIAVVGIVGVAAVHACGREVATYDDY